MDPMKVLLDFKEAMSSVWEKVFPENSIMHNFSYLQQANTKKMDKIGCFDLQSEVVEDIQMM
jgi:hypothetical protein